MCQKDEEIGDVALTGTGPPESEEGQFLMFFHESEGLQGPEQLS